MNNEEHIEKLKSEEAELEAMLYAGQEEETVEQVIEVQDGMDVAVVETPEIEVAEEVDKVEHNVAQPAKTKRTSWKPKYEELQVRYTRYRTTTDAKLFQLRSQLTKLAEQRKQDSKIIDELSKKVANTVKDVDPFEGVITEEQMDMLGPEAIEVMKKMNTVSSQAATQPLLDKIARMEKVAEDADEAFVESQANEANTSFKARLAELVPDLGTVDTDPEFITYLQRPDPINGETNWYWFKDAQSRGNVTEVAKYFNEYKEETREPENILEQHLNPVGRRGQSTMVQPEQIKEDGLIAFSEWEGFQGLMASGRFKGTQAEAQELDNYYEKALREGRIRPDDQLR